MIFSIQWLHIVRPFDILVEFHDYIFLVVIYYIIIKQLFEQYYQMYYELGLK